jgi:predicted dehydrogenase
VRKIKELLQSDHIGDVYYYDSVRINLGLFQTDVNVIWDLAVHDLSILDFILGRHPVAVACNGSGHVPGRPVDVAYISIYFDGDLIAHVHASWLSPLKLRRTLIGGNRKMIVYDDIEPYEKVRVHDKGIIVDDLEERHHLRRIGYRSGDVWCPQVDATEALRIEVAHFIRCIEGKERPITDGQSGLRIVRLLEAADRSLALKGKPVELHAMGVAA